MTLALGPRLRVALVAALLAFCIVLTVPADAPGLFGPPDFAWASWCYAFAVPVLLVALGSGHPLGVRLLWPAVAYLAWIAVVAPFGVDPANSLRELVMVAGIVLAALAAAWVSQLDGRAPAWMMGTMALVVTVVQLLGFLHHVEAGLAERITAYLLPRGWSGYPELGLLVAVQFVVLSAGFLALKGWCVRLAALVLAGITVVEAAFLYSRVAWVSVAAVLVALPFLAGLKRQMLLPLATALATVVLIVAGAAALSPSFTQLGRGVLSGDFGGGGRVEGVTLNVADLSRRTVLWRRTAQMARDHWLMGVGLGNFARVFETRYHTEVDDTGRRGPHAHNAFLQAAAELGVPGAVILLAVWGVALGTSVRGTFRRPTPARIAIVGCVVVMLVQSQADYFSYSLNGPRGRLTALIWCTLAAASALNGARARIAGGPTPSRRPPPQLG